MKDIRDEEQIMPEEKSDYDRKLEMGYAADAFNPMADNDMPNGWVVGGSAAIFIGLIVFASYFGN